MDQGYNLISKFKGPWSKYTCETDLAGRNVMDTKHYNFFLGCLLEWLDLALVPHSYRVIFFLVYFNL